MDLHIAKASEIEDLESFYRITDYGGSVSPVDKVAYATDDGKIIGVGRLTKQEGVFVLRGIRVLKEHRRRGIGNALLDSLAREVGSSDCLCISYSHLRKLYENRGFCEIKPLEAPKFLRSRYNGYRARGLDVILMRKSPIS